MGGLVVLLAAVFAGVFHHPLHLFNIGQVLEGVFEVHAPGVFRVRLLDFFQNVLPGGGRVRGKLLEAFPVEKGRVRAGRGVRLFPQGIGLFLLLHGFQRLLHDSGQRFLGNAFGQEDHAAGGGNHLDGRDVPDFTGRLGQLLFLFRHFLPFILDAPEDGFRGVLGQVLHGAGDFARFGGPVRAGPHDDHVFVDGFGLVLHGAVGREGRLDGRGQEEGCGQQAGNDVEMMKHGVNGKGCRGYFS